MEEEIQNIEGFLQAVKTFKAQQINIGNTADFLFRGQPGDFPLLPKILRLQPKNDLLETERLIFQEFKRTNPLLIAPYSAIDDWDTLTLGQHFGLPTRLLDWTDKALTALWFATDNTIIPSTKQKHALVWVLMAEKGDYLHDDEIQISPFDRHETKLYRPRIIKQRINNQSGMFSIHSTYALKNKLFLSEEDNFRTKLLKIKIPKANFASIRVDLNVLGVNAFTIFPELEGLSTFLQWKFFD